MAAKVFEECGSAVLRNEKNYTNVKNGKEILGPCEP